MKGIGKTGGYLILLIVCEQLLSTDEVKTINSIAL